MPEADTAAAARKKQRVVLSWSSGKDSAWSLYQLQQDPDVELVALLTTFNAAADRVAMHAVRHQLVTAQAAAADLPLVAVALPWPCSNADYEAIMSQTLDSLREDYAPTHIAFGDLYLEDIRDYRLRQMQDTGIGTLFPLWQSDTKALARAMIDGGLQAVLTCVDPKAMPRELAGAAFDANLLAQLPDSVDPCGENGEFHTFVHAGPMFRNALPIIVGKTLERDGFVFTDVEPADTDAS
ncbi:MAG: ATP-binding protein [Gammaproteobacteria bacterium]